MFGLWPCSDYAFQSAHCGNLSPQHMSATWATFSVLEQCEICCSPFVLLLTLMMVICPNSPDWEVERGKGEEAAKGLDWCMCFWGLRRRINFLEQALPSLPLSVLHCLPLPILQHDRTPDFQELELTSKLVFSGLAPNKLFPQKIFTLSKLRLRSYHDHHRKPQIKRK